MKRIIMLIIACWIVLLARGQNVAGYEYWFDNQYEHKVSTATSSSTINLVLDVSSLQPGLHYVNMRAKDTKGLWSVPTTQCFYRIGKDLSQNKITQYEYWFDNQYGSKTTASTTSNQIDFSISVSSLCEGMHYLNFRVKDAEGLWSVPTTQCFYRIGKDLSRNKITQYEYWFNQEDANKKRVEATNELIDLSLDVSALKAGIHSLCFRAQDTEGLWSSASITRFARLDPNDEQPEMTLFNGKAYQIFDKPLSWHDAKLYCEALGGSLACITSSDEQEFITSLLGEHPSIGYYWLGGTDATSDNTWQWVSGEPWEYSHWEVGEPNRLKDEFYLQMYGYKDGQSIEATGKWNDLPADGSPYMTVSDGSFAFICERELTGYGSLTVSLPEESTKGQYRNLILELTNPSTKQILTLSTTDALQYTFGGLSVGSIYNVALKNKGEALLGTIDNVQIAQNENKVTFTTLQEVIRVAVSVRDTTNQDVTALTTIKWYDQAKKFISQGDTIQGQTVDNTLYYQVELKDSLKAAYLTPDLQSYTIVSGTNNPQLTLRPIPTVTLTGVVKGKEGKPIRGATVYITQMLSGQLSKSVTTQTNADGRFSLQVFNVVSTVTLSYPNYITQTLSKQNFDAEGALLGELNLATISGATITTQLNYQPSVETGQKPTTGLYDNYQNIAYALYNITQEQVINDFVVQHPLVVIVTPTNAGDRIRITATSRTEAFQMIQQVVSVDNELRATAPFTIVQQGAIKAHYTKSELAESVAIIYDKEGKFVEKQVYKNKSALSSHLPEGAYSVVSMANSQFFNSIQDLSELTTSGLVEDEDYVVSQVTVQSGVIQSLTVPSIPTLNESKLYYTGSETLFSVNKSSLMAGSYVTLRGKVTFHENYQSRVSDVKLVVDLPPYCSFVENSVMVGTQVSTGYSVSGDRLTVPLADYQDVVRFSAIPLQGGSFAPSAFVEFMLDGKTIKQPIGVANFKANNLNFVLPTKTAHKTVKVSGVAMANSAIVLYDNGVVVGQGRSLANGSWSTEIELYEPRTRSVHDIHAEMKTSGGVTVLTETKTLTYDPNCIEVSKVTMINVAHPATSLDLCEYVTEFNYLAPAAKSPVYWYWPNYPTFLFKVEFTKNDPTVVSNVKVNAITNSGKVVPLSAVYDTNKHIWVAKGDFDTYNLPINVHVDYDAKEANTYTVEDLYQIKPTQTLQIENARLNALSDVEYDAEFSLKGIDDFKFRNREKIEVVGNTFNKEGYAAIDIAGGKQVWVKNQGQLINKYTYEEGYSILIPYNVWMDLSEIIQKDADEYAHVIDRFNGTVSANQSVLCTSLIRYSDVKQSGKQNQLRADPLTDELRDELLGRVEDQFRQQIDAFGDKVAANNYRRIDAYRTQIRKMQTSGCEDGGMLAMELDRLNRLEKQYFRLKQVSGTFDAIGGVAGLVSKPAERFIYYYDRGITQPSGQLGFEITMKMVSNNLLSLKNYCPYDENMDLPPSPSPAPDGIPVQDPSGYVYEAVPTNRLEGVTTTIYYKATEEDNEGNPTDVIVLWDAENYQQENPLLTDQNGMYAWDVPTGSWQVKYEKEGYQTAYSDWLPVPPPQLDVNIGLVQHVQPTVSFVKGYEERIEIDFNKFMLESTLTTGRITVMQKGSPIAGTISYLDSEVNPLKSSEQFVSKICFIPNQAFAVNDVLELTVDQMVKSYAGIQMSQTYTQTVTIAAEVKSMEATTSIEVDNGGRGVIRVSALPESAAAGMRVIVHSSSPSIIRTATEVLLDAQGKAEIPIEALLPGMAYVTASLEKTRLQTETNITVAMPIDQVSKPTASIASGSVVAKDEMVLLVSGTSGAVIYYTTDGSCPCTSPTKVRYVAPIPITDDLTLQVIAVKEGMLDSELATFTYTVFVSPPTDPEDPSNPEKPVDPEDPDNPSVGIDDVEQIPPYALGGIGKITVLNAAGAYCSVYSMNGALIYRKGSISHGEEIPIASTGVYVVEIVHNQTVLRKKVGVR